MPNIRQRLSSDSWTQRTPAGLPWGMPGMGDEIEIAMQHAPQPIRHCIYRS
jgi:oxygen-independent coproporphyrinogen-3 oxidase